MKKIEVVAAVIMKNSKILAVQKSKAKFEYVSYKWEFPGGKVELDETFEQAIKREIQEELNIQIIPTELLITVEHQYPDFHLTMHCFSCCYESGELRLNEHIALKWLNNDELDQLDWAAADLPVVNKLIENDR